MLEIGAEYITARAGNEPRSRLKPTEEPIEKETRNRWNEPVLGVHNKIKRRGGINNSAPSFRRFVMLIELIVNYCAR